MRIVSFSDPVRVHFGSNFPDSARNRLLRLWRYTFAKRNL